MGWGIFILVGVMQRTFPFPKITCLPSTFLLGRSFSFSSFNRVINARTLLSGFNVVSHLNGTQIAYCFSLNVFFPQYSSFFVFVFVCFFLQKAAFTWGSRHIFNARKTSETKNTTLTFTIIRNLVIHCRDNDVGCLYLLKSSSMCVENNMI